MQYTDFYTDLLESKVPEELQKKYADLGTAQRGEAETLGALRQHRLLQGSLDYPLEHIGDLVHRLSFNTDKSKHHGFMQNGGGLEYGREAALTKVKKALSRAEDFKSYGGMKKFVEEIAKKNYDYVINNNNYEKYKDWDTEWQNVLDYLKRYTDEHIKLAPLCYSYYQKLGNDATIALGELDERTYVNSLILLKNLLEKPNWKKYWYSSSINL